MQNTINLTRTQWVRINSKKALFFIFWCLYFHEVYLKYSYYLWCLVLLQVAKWFVPFQIFCIGPKIYLHIVPVTSILCQTKRWFAFGKIGVCIGSKVFEEAQIKCSQLFGLTQNIWTGTKHFATCKRTRHYCFIKTGARSYENA